MCKNYQLEFWDIKQVISLCFINRIYCNPAQDEWSILLLRNLLEVIDDNWEMIFDEETGEAPTDEELDFMIAAVCAG